MLHNRPPQSGLETNKPSLHQNQGGSVLNSHTPSRTINPLFCKGFDGQTCSTDQRVIGRSVSATKPFGVLSFAARLTVH